MSESVEDLVSECVEAALIKTDFSRHADRAATRIVEWWDECEEIVNEDSASSMLDYVLTEVVLAYGDIAAVTEAFGAIHDAVDPKRTDIRATIKANSDRVYEQMRKRWKEATH